MKYIKHIILMAFVMVMATMSANAMQIFVHFSNGTWPTSLHSYDTTSDGKLIFEMGPSDSFENLKEKIGDKTGFNPSGMKLSYGTYDNLADDQTLYQCGIPDGATINLTTIPYRTNSDHNSWAFKMPKSDRVLRTTWKQACELAFEKDTTVYRVFTSTLQNPLTNPHNLDVTYSSSNTNVATVATDGTVTVKGVGNATITATTTGNNDYQACSASYDIQVKEPYKLTLLTVGNGTVDTSGIMPGVILDTANYNDGNKHYLVMPGTGAVDLKATPNLLNYLVNWSNNVTVSNDNPLNAFVMLSDHVTVTATFAMYPILVVEKEGVGSVTVEKKENSTYVDITNTSTNNEYTLPPGTEVRLTATAGANNHFDKLELGYGL